MPVPIVGIPCDYRDFEDQPFHAVAAEYVDAVCDAAGAMPLLIPVTDRPLDPLAVTRTLDGILFTGSESNIAPWRYGGAEAREGVPGDPRRDAAALGLLIAAIGEELPVLCICRGFEELNVAFGGTLHQHVHELEGRMDHRADETLPRDAQYAPAHKVEVAPGCLLGRIAGRHAFDVNSLHGQGVDRLAPRLHPDAIASDGLIEAVSMPDARGFVLGLQWHPEWRWREDAVSRAIWEAFGAAVRERVQKRSASSLTASGG
ncbi:MAG: gamma-glutamyl-gamma-aminobutyrate hydrolase family protein [Alphaproteobacteria bacterium]|nr:gamma-glutamyl-gamma-aminobutyrate hydrolase family protein [Alphaproteobacteria bacterium]